jgi:hypothetical protein
MIFIMMQKGLVAINDKFDKLLYHIDIIFFPSSGSLLLIALILHREVMMARLPVY